MWVEKTSKGHFKFVESYKDPYTGKTKRVSKTYEKNTPAIRKKALQELNALINKALNKVNEITYNEAVGVYLKSIEVKPTTFKNKKSTLIKSKKYFSNGDMYLSRITGAYIRDFYSKEDYIPRTAMDILKTFFNWCYKNDYMKTPVFDKITLKPQRNNPEYEKLYFEKYELKEIFEKLEQLSTYKGQFTRYLVEFLTLTGLRPGEALALTHSDLRGKTLSITKRSVEGKIDTPKTKKSVREITVNSRVVQIVNEMKLLKRIYQINSDIIFPNMRGAYSTTPGIYITLKKCGVYPSRLHIYRHTHASILAEMKIPLDVIQRRLGHEDSDITKKIYVHVTEKLKQEEQELFKSLEII